MWLLALNGVIGASVAITIGVASRSRAAFVAGLLPLVPTFVLFDQLLPCATTAAACAPAMASLGMLALLPYAGYLAAFAACLETEGLRRSIGLASAVWLGMALLAAALWRFILAPLG